MFNKFNFLISNFCAKDNTRPKINGVFVNGYKETCATDDYTLALVRNSNVDIKSFPELPNKKTLKNFNAFILPQDKAKEVVKMCKANKSMPILENAVITHKDNETAEISTTDLTSVNSVMSRIIQGEFPKYNALLVEKGKFMEVRLNPKYLKKIAEFFSQFCETTDGVLVKIPYEKNNPIRFEAHRKMESGVQEALSILMPIKSETGN
jgi:hypothetical protein